MQSSQKAWPLYTTTNNNINNCLSRQTDTWSSIYFILLLFTCKLFLVPYSCRNKNFVMFKNELINPNLSEWQHHFVLSVPSRVRDEPAFSLISEQRLDNAPRELSQRNISDSNLLLCDKTNFHTRLNPLAPAKPTRKSMQLGSSFDLQICIQPSRKLVMSQKR